MDPPPPSTFDTIYPIDLKFGTYDKLHLYFQLSETTWCLIGFHGNNRHISDVTGGRHLGFSNFQILFNRLVWLFAINRTSISRIYSCSELVCAIVDLGIVGLSVMCAHCGHNLFIYLCKT